jgi:tetratricopeptide (TPR) repeat protein
MSPTIRANLVGQAHHAADQGDWEQAYQLLVAADSRTPLNARELPLLADMAYAVGRPELTITTWERVHADSVRAGDPISAAGAAVRVAMHLLFDTGYMAPVRGWISRARQLLEGDEENPVGAWLAVVRSYERLLSGDLEHAMEWADQAILVGAEADRAAAAVGRVAKARTLVLQGEVTTGVELLNEAAVAAVSGELDSLFTGVVYCEVVCALQALAQYDLAEEWTVAMEAWRHGQPVGSVHGRCRVHRAEILRLRGSSVEAEEEAQRACEELRPYLGRELGWPLTELGRIRLRRGDVEAAEGAFREAHEVGWDPHPGLALVHLAKGDLGLAVESIRGALEHPLRIPSKEFPPNTELRRAPLLEAQVEIELAAGNLGVAREAALELTDIAATFGSRTLEANAALALARVDLAEGSASRACLGFQEALDIWSDVGAPYEAGLARMGLGYAHRAAGREERAKLEFEAARSGFQRVGALRRASEADKALLDEWTRGGQEWNEQARAQILRRSDKTFRREGDFWSLTFQGRTIRLSNLKGLGYLARLLAEPGREVHAFDLVTWGRNTRTPEAPSSGPQSLDAQAKDAYRRRLEEIDEDVETALLLGDHDRVAQAEAERDILIRELSRAIGLGGRDRRVGSESERARASVTRAIRRAMARIRNHHPELGEHLDRFVRTGTYCSYLPDPASPPVWRL